MSKEKICQKFLKNYIITGGSTIKHCFNLNVSSCFENFYVNKINKKKSWQRFWYSMYWESMGSQKLEHFILFLVQVLQVSRCTLLLYVWYSKIIILESSLKQSIVNELNKYVFNQLTNLYFFHNNGSLFHSYSYPLYWLSSSSVVPLFSIDMIDLIYINFWIWSTIISTCIVTLLHIYHSSAVGISPLSPFLSFIFLFSSWRLDVVEPDLFFYYCMAV